jgi:hypothetical protein
VSPSNSDQQKLIKISDKKGKRRDSRQKKKTKRRRLSEDLQDDQCSSGKESNKDIGFPVGEEEDMEGNNDSKSGMSS